MTLVFGKHAKFSLTEQKDKIVEISYTTNNYVHKITKDGVSVCDIETLWVERTDEANIADYDLSLTKK